MKVDPASPKKIEAGLKLYLKKPKQAPTRAKEISARSGWLLFKASIRKKDEAITPMPETNPSMPSSMFIELVIKVMKHAAKTQLIGSNLKRLNDMPAIKIKRKENAKWDQIL